MPAYWSGGGGNRSNKFRLLTPPASTDTVLKRERAEFMLRAIENLLILQDRDTRIHALEAEMEGFAPQRSRLQGQTAAGRARQEAAKTQLHHLESERKELELEVVAQQDLIAKYSLQQFQTKKNDEYRALTHEIENCKAEIVRLEDRQLELMEQAERTQQELREATRHLEAVTREADTQLAELAGREAELRARLAELTGGRAALAQQVEGLLLPRYERLRKSKGDRVVVGVEHGCCGGCHMKLPTQIVVHCQGALEVVACPNCARLLYYTTDMDLAVAD